MKRTTKIIIGSIVVLAVLFISLGLPWSVKEDMGSLNRDNTELYSSLAEQGFEDTVVDINPERTLVRYNVPEGMDVERSEMLVLGAVSKTSNSSRIVLQVYKGFEPLEEVEVDIKTVEKFVDGRITYQKLQDRIIRKDIEIEG